MTFSFIFKKILLTGNLQWIEKAANWEKYELDARIGLKIATAQDTLRRWHEKEGSTK